MKQLWRLFFNCIFLFSLLMAGPALAQEAGHKKIKMEFGPVEDADSYEFEIVGNGKTQIFKAAQPEWSGFLQPGNYELRMRSYDHRKVPGEWSNAEPFEVERDHIALLSPVEAAVISALGSKQISVNFSWTAIGKSRSYELQVTGPDGFLQKLTTKKLAASLELPVGASYTWQVTALGPLVAKGQISAKFTVVGGPLESPILQTPESFFVRTLSWSKPPSAQTFDVEILRHDKMSDNWLSVLSRQDLSETTIAFEAKWPGGEYRLRLRARAENWQPSAVAESHFSVFDGDRSPESELANRLQNSDDRCENFCGMAGYSITNLSYTSNSYDSAKPSQAQFSALGGTGQVGLIKRNKKSPWGFQVIAEYSGLRLKQGNNVNYGSGEANVMRKFKLEDSSFFRLYGGFFYREDPVMIGDATTLQVTDTTKVSAIGPHFGVDYSKALNARFGLQLNFHIYNGVLKISTPNGEPIKSAVYTQFGVLASYILAGQWTGFAGLANRIDKVSYGVPASGRISANEVAISGTFLNLILEKNF